MQINRCLTGVLTIAIGLAGCGGKKEQASESPKVVGAVAVLDLDEVARRLGRDLEMTDSIKQRESSLNQQLVTVQASYQEELKGRKDALGEQPSEQATKELAGLAQQANLKLNEARQQAIGILSQHKANLIRRFRDEAQPVAREVAAAKGLSIIITKNDSVVFAYESAVDITDEVVGRMRNAPPAARPEDRTAAQPPARTDTR